MPTPHEVVVHFLPMIDGVGDRESYFRVQFELLQWLSECERQISQLRDKPGSFGAPSVRGGRGLAPPGAVQRALREAEWAKQLLLHVGDSLAWRLLPREFIRASATVRKGGFVTFRRGFDGEVQVFRAIHDARPDKIALMNDLTHCLGMGDLIVVGGGRLAIIEVKSGRQTPVDDPRLGRQDARSKWLAENDAVEEGKLPRAPHFESPDWIRIKLDTPEEYHHEQLSTIIEEATRNTSGWATEALSENGCIVAIRRGASIEDTDFFDVLDRIRVGEDRELFMGCINRIPEGIPDILPIPLFDMSFESRVKLLVDDVIVFVGYSRGNVLRALATRGFKESENISKGVSVLDKDGKTRIGVVHLITRLCHELLSLDSLVGLIADGAREADRFTAEAGSKSS